MKTLVLLSLLISISFVSTTLASDHRDKKELVCPKTELLGQKLSEKEQQIEVGTGWYDSRLITPRTHLYLKDADRYTLFQNKSDDLSLHLYKQQSNQGDSVSKSQGLIRDAESSFGTSVDTSIRTNNKRSTEKKTTFVQYDKNNIHQTKRDFSVDSGNEKGTANYDGGHLVDHKFSAQGSHTDAFNYVPQHHFYNRWLKEYIVKSVEGYLEIPLFTSNPPQIKVLNENRYDKIPIGIILVTLANKTIKDAYYFPNNQYNYRTLQGNLKIGKKDMSKNMISNFKLKKDFHTLLWPAIIHDISKQGDNLKHQLKQEDKGINLINSLIDGMSVLSMEDVKEDVLSALANNVIHQENIKLSNILDVSKSNIAHMKQGQANQSALSQSFNALGQFLIEYAMNNAMKSEVISTHSRIMFANIITDFIDCYFQVESESLDRVDQIFTESYADTLDDLWKIKDKMELEDLLYFANLHQKLSSPSIHAGLFNCGGYEICDDISDLSTNFSRFIEVLQCLHKTTTNLQLNEDQKQNSIDLFLEAQHSLSYLIATGFPAEEYKNERLFLKKAKNRVKKWGKKLGSMSGGSYQNSPNSGVQFRAMPGLKMSEIEYLGTTCSIYYSDNSSESLSEEESS